MLMGWGPFRFTVPNYSVETLRRTLQPRSEQVPVIGALPITHNLGPNVEELTLESTFHPRHLNGRGLTQLAGVREAVNSLTPLSLVHMNGSGMNIFGRWTAKSLSSEKTVFDVHGVPQTVTTTLTMTQYDGSGGARAAALAAVFGGFNLELGYSSGSFSAGLKVVF